MARFYANENFPLPVVEELRVLGHNVMTIQEAGKSGQGVSDADVLDFATVDRRAVLTLNRRHFLQLHRARQDHAGIIVCTVDFNFVALAHRIDAAVIPHADLTHKVIQINRPRPFDLEREKYDRHRGAPSTPDTIQRAAHGRVATVVQGQNVGIKDEEAHGASGCSSSLRRYPSIASRHAVAPSRCR